MDKKSIFLALFIFIIIITAFYFSIDEVPITPENPETEENGAEEELEEVNFFVYNEEQKQELKLISQRVDNFKEEQRMELKPVEVEVYDIESGELLYTLDGDAGTYYTAQKYLEIRGNVVVDSDRYHILSDELDYYIQRNYLEGRGAVKISGEDFSSRAESFNSNLQLNDLELSKNDSPGKAVISFNQLEKDNTAEESNVEESNDE
mgnify:CR=1 FL=1